MSQVGLVAHNVWVSCAQGFTGLVSCTQKGSMFGLVAHRVSQVGLVALACRVSLKLVAHIEAYEISGWELNATPCAAETKL